VTVDAVQGCRLFIGPTSGSVFLRGPVACHITVAAKQLRVRDAVGCTIAAHTPSAPAIESSCGLHFLPFNGAYPGIDAHFEAAELDPTSNAWSQVYDFSEDDRSLPAPHWQPLSFTSWEGSDGCPSPAAQLAVGYIFDRFDTDGDGVWGAEDFAAYAAALEEDPVPGEHLAALLQSLPPVASEVLGGWGVSAPGGGEVWPEVGQHAVTPAGMTMWGLVALLASEGTDAIPKAAQALGMDPRHALTDWIAATDALLASMAAQLPWDVLVAVTVSGAAASPLPLPLEDAPAVATFVAFALAQSLAKASSSAKADHMTGQDLLAALRGMVVVPVAWPGQEAGPVTLPLSEGALQDTLRLVGSGSTEDRGGPAELAALVPIQMLVALVRIRLQGDLEARGLAGPLP
ncbi:TBCC, partial [Symbiodinium sp. KB8]